MTARTLSYEMFVANSWQKVNMGIMEFCVAINKEGADFSDVYKAADSLTLIVSEKKTALSRVTPPSRYADFNRFYLLYLNHLQLMFGLVKEICIFWSESKARKLENLAQATKLYYQSCVNFWPGQGKLSYPPNLFVAMHNVDKVLRDRVTRPGGARSIPDVDVNALIQDQDAHNRAFAYLADMHNLLMQYRKLREELDRFLTNINMTKQGVPISSPKIRLGLREAKAARIKICNQMRAIEPCTGWERTHDSCINCVQNGIEAIDALERGDYETFHIISKENTQLLYWLISTYE